MRRWDYDGSDDQDKDEMDNLFNPDGSGGEDGGGMMDENGLSDEEMNSIIHQQDHDEAMSYLHLEAVYQEMDQRLLDSATKFCQDSWFWKFKSKRTRLKEITRTYLTFERMVRNARDRRHEDV